MARWRSAIVEEAPDLVLMDYLREAVAAAFLV
jgi:hypothetical protein